MQRQAIAIRRPRDLLRQPFASKLLTARFNRFGIFCSCPFAPMRAYRRTNGRFVAPTSLLRVPMEPSPRKLVGITLILGSIVVWAAFVASLARTVGTWPVLIQAGFYLIMGLVWIIPLKPIVRWMETGSFRRQPLD